MSARTSWRIRDRLRAHTVDILWVGGIVLALAVIWEGVIKIFDVPSFILPTLEDMFEELVISAGYYAHHALFTLINTLVGFALATVIGVAMALCIVSSGIFDRIFTTLLAMMHNLPKVALAPVLVLWLGTGAPQKITIAVLVSIFTIVVDTVVGMRSIDPEVISMARVKHASTLQILLKLKLPQALPNLFGALKAAAAFSLVGALVGEFVGGQEGLGYVILVAQGMFDTARAFVAVFLLGVMGTVLYYLIVAAEAKLLPWHVSQRHH